MSIDLIAEIGSNHCGKFNLAMAHIQGARAAFATGVKFQLFRAESLDSRPAVQTVLKRAELPLDWLPHLGFAAHEQGLTFGVTPFAVDLVEPLRGVVDWVKISAYDLLYEDLVKAAATLNVPLVLSTAMATSEEIETALTWLPRMSLVLLYGVASYPAPFHQHDFASLRRLHAIPAATVGLSDHTTDELAACIATAHGARWIEKHFRLSNTDFPEIANSPDFHVSATPMMFKSMAQRCRAIAETCDTTFPPGPQACELALYQTARRTNAKPRRGDTQ